MKLEKEWPFIVIVDHRVVQLSMYFKSLYHWPRTRLMLTNLINFWAARHCLNRQKHGNEAKIRWISGSCCQGTCDLMHVLDLEKWKVVDIYRHRQISTKIKSDAFLRRWSPRHSIHHFGYRNVNKTMKVYRITSLATQQLAHAPTVTLNCFKGYS